MTDIFDFPGADEMKAEERRQRKPRQDMKTQTAQDTIVDEDEILAAGFTMMPNLVLFREDLTADAKLVYLGLRSYAWQKESCFPGQTALAKRVGLSRRTIQRGLAQLQEKGLLRVEHRGFAETNRYVLLKLT